jgi:hypothetical protein
MNQDQHHSAPAPPEGRGEGGPLPSDLSIPSGPPGGAIPPTPGARSGNLEGVSSTEDPVFG